MDASFGHDNSDSLDMSWLPLSREVWVASGVCCRVLSRARGEVPHQISVGSRLDVHR
jgi:hypothetical protein